MKKFLLIFVAFVLSVSLASCKVYDDTKDIISDNRVEENGEHENENKDDGPVKVSLTLYFPDNDALYLYPEIRELEVQDKELLAQTVLEELFKGPTLENLSPSLDGENLVLSVSVSEGICTVDFDDDFILLNSGGTTRENFAIGSIVNSLCELEDVEQVKINIGGNTSSAFGGHFTLEAPFAFQENLIGKNK